MIHATVYICLKFRSKQVIFQRGDQRHTSYPYWLYFVKFAVAIILLLCLLG